MPDVNDHDPDRLDGRVALVTGGGRGIGRAIACELARRGAAVSVVARSEAELEAVSRETGGVHVAVSLATEDGCLRAVSETRRALGPIAILINNAGLGTSSERPIWDQETDLWRASMALNLDAPFWLTRAAVGDMVDQGWGRIVMISSTAGQVGAPSMSAYCASKHGVIGLARAVAQDVAAHGITCNAVLPGWVRTGMADVGAGVEARRRGITAEEVWAERAAGYPANRVLEPEEIASVVRFLCSQAASGVNGEAITAALGSYW